MGLTRVSGDVIQSTINVGVVTATGVNVGTAVTIHTGGFRVGSSDLHSSGLTVQNLNSTGVVTATTFSGNLTGNINGNINSSGVSTFFTIKVGTAVTISGGIVTATTFSGSVTGNVAGNLTGNVSGNVTGNVSGNVNAGILTATNRIVLNTLNIIGSGTSIGIGSDQPTATLDIAGRIKTTEASAVSYASTITGITPQAEYVGGSSNQFLVYSEQAYVSNNGANADWVNMHSFSPEKDGDVTMRASMRITSGSYYFVWRVYEETGRVLFTAAPAGYYAYESPSGQSGNVHSLKMYQWYVRGLKAGKRYNIQMAASSGDGTVLQNGTSQVLTFGRFDITSNSPGYMPGSNIMIPQNRSYSGADQVYYGSPNENSYIPTIVQNFRGTCETFLGWYTMRAYSRYLDIKLNLNSDSYMFFFRATGYLYNYGHANDSFYGGYMYTNNSIINKTSSTTNKGFSDVYRSSDGFLCARFDQTANGYSEGQLAIFFGTHGPVDRGIQVMEYIQNDNVSNYFA